MSLFSRCTEIERGPVRPRASPWPGDPALVLFTVSQRLWALEPASRRGVLGVGEVCAAGVLCAQPLALCRRRNQHHHVKGLALVLNVVLEAPGA